MFENKRIAFADINFSYYDKIKTALKPIGGRVVKNINKNVDILVCGTQAVGLSAEYRSAEYQTKMNNKFMMTYDAFLKKAEEAGADISQIKDAATFFQTETKEDKIAALKLATAMHKRYQVQETVLQFCDDIYEMEDASYSNNLIKFDDDVAKAIDDILDIPNFYQTHILNNKACCTIDDIINACGGYSCIDSIITMCLAVRLFVNPNFHCKFRIYRDKWEYRGDYFGMCAHTWEVPPMLYWEINETHPFGYTSFIRYT